MSNEKCKVCGGTGVEELLSSKGRVEFTQRCPECKDGIDLPFGVTDEATQETGRYDFEKKGLGHQTQKGERTAEYIKSELERLHLMASENGMVKPGSGSYKAFCDLIDVFAGIAVSESDAINERV